MYLLFNAVGVALLIAQGWRQPTLGYVCSREINAVGVVLFCVECRDKTPKNKRYNAYSVVVTNGKEPRVDYAFACQPWAIKSTTPTALLPQ